MTNEELQEKIEFILEQQTQLIARVDRLVQIQTEVGSSLSQKIEALAEFQAHSETRLSRVEESFILLVQMAKITDERLDSLTESQARLGNKVEELAEMQKSLTESQKNTDEGLNTLIQVVERYISEGRNGKI